MGSQVDVVRRLINLAGDLCEQNVRVAKWWRRDTTKQRCSREATWEVNGRYLCSVHAGMMALQCLEVRTKERQHQENR